MSEYWKSTPRYWCKYCSCYVRDTKLERQNHEATAKHQGALRRSLRDLHRTHEREERDKERARLEVARLNGVVSSRAAPPQPQPDADAEAERKRQREQLAALGVAVPNSVRAEMAMAGEWTVMSTRVLDGGEARADAVATGVRKREETEEQRDEEAAVRRLFKKPRRWGRDSRAMPDDEDRELDALLSGPAAAGGVETAGDEGAGGIKTDENEGADYVKTDGNRRADHVKTKTASVAAVVETDGDHQDADGVKTETELEEDPVAVKDESDTGADKGAPAPVVFKKRKPKGLRTK